MVLYLGKIIYRCHVFFLAEMYFLFVYSHFAYFRPKSGVSPTHLKWNTLIPVDMHHNNNTILSSHHHGNTFSLQWNTLIDMHYNNNTIFSSHHHGNSFSLQWNTLIDMHYNNNLVATTMVTGFLPHHWEPWRVYALKICVWYPNTTVSQRQVYFLCHFDIALMHKYRFLKSRQNTTFWL